MIVILKKNADKAQLDRLIAWLEQSGLGVHTSVGSHETILGLIGDTSKVDIDLISQLDIVDTVKRVQEPYKNANRKFHPENTVIKVGNASIGDGSLTLIAGPCSVESEEQICSIAESVKKSGAHLMRGGAFKPRTSPYSFQGLREEGLRLLALAKQHTGLPIVTEIMDVSQMDNFVKYGVDVVQVGARNMQNFELLKALGSMKKPILLKRGLANTYEELLMSAEYIMSGGCDEVMLCERGIRTFETYTRNTLDVAAIPVLKTLSHLPIIIDPSHSAGKSALVTPLSYAAAAAGADGLIIEVHNDPAHALCDGPQCIKPDTFDALVKKLEAIREALK